MTTATFRAQRVLDLPVHVLTLEEAVDVLEGFCAEHGPCRRVVTLNVEMSVQARRDTDLRDVIETADLIIADSVGIQWAARLPYRVPGIDLTQATASKGSKRGAKYFLFGAAPGVAREAADALQREHPGLEIVGVEHGYHDDSEHSQIISAINEAEPDYLLVALGAGRQEAWIKQHASELKAKVAIGVGGSLDVLSGRAKRAPEWTQKLGVEWMYRVVLSPSRWGRALALPKFVLIVLGRRLLGR